ncbi:MAG: homoserine O-succinyltransferase [Pseudomonadota bacterium]
MSALLKTVEAEGATPAWSDREIALPGAFRLANGQQLADARLRVRLHGDPGAPVIAAAGGISASRAVAGDEAGWWRDCAGPGRAIDTRNYCLLGFDFLPNPGEPKVTLTTGDQARALACALDALGVDALRAFVGASYGGMVALAFAAAYPDRVQKLVAISAADRPHGFGVAIRGVQRRILAFAAAQGKAEDGVSLARQIAMLSYRSPEEFDTRFEVCPPQDAGGAYPHCDYLVSRGEAFSMEPDRYLALSDSIDRHAVDIASVRAPSLFIAAQSDLIAPPAQIRRLAAAAPRARYIEIFSTYGHDAFLKETAAIGPFITRFLEEDRK